MKRKRTPLAPWAIATRIQAVEATMHPDVDTATEAANEASRLDPDVYVNAHFPDGSVRVKAGKVCIGQPYWKMPPGTPTYDYADDPQGRLLPPLPRFRDGE